MARTPLAFTPVKSEPLLQGQVDEMEARAAELPHREQSLALTARFLRRLLELHLEFIDEVEQELR